MEKIDKSVSLTLKEKPATQKIIYGLSKKMRTRVKKYFKWISIFLIISSGFILINNEIISKSARDLIFDNINEIPECETGLLLGVPMTMPGGRINSYYLNRVSAGVELYKNQKIEKILISADIYNKYEENEVELIKSDLLRNSVLEKDLLYDKKGNRTWHSIDAASDMCGNNFIIISQKFHLERALYISQKMGLNAIGFCSKGEASTKIKIREILARVLMQKDLFLSD